MSKILRGFWTKKPKVSAPVLQDGPPGLDAWKLVVGDYVAVTNKVQELQSWQDGDAGRFANALKEVDNAVAVPDYVTAANKFGTLRTEVNRIHGAAATRRQEEQNYHSAHDPVKDKIAEILSPGDEKLPEDLKGERTTFGSIYRDATNKAGTGNHKDALVELNKILGQTDGLQNKIKVQLKAEADYTKLHKLADPKFVELRNAKDNAWPQELKNERTSLLDGYTDLDLLTGALKFVEALSALKVIAGKPSQLLVKATNHFQTEFTNAKQALVNGDLAKVPPDAPPGVETEHGAVLSAKAVVGKDPKAIDDCIAGLLELETLATKVADYLKAEKLVFDAKKLEYDNAKTQLENGDLKKVPASAPRGLEGPYGAVTTARSKLPADPKTIAEYIEGRAAVSELATKVSEFLAAVLQQKNDCVKEYNKIGALYNEANKVPELNEELATLIQAKDRAYTAFYNQYKTGKNYAEATELLAALQEKSQAVITASIKAGLQSKPEISGEQDLRATNKLNAMGETDKKNVEKLLDDAPTEKHRQNLRKAIACGYTPDEITTFAARIQDKDEQWLQDNLHLTTSSTGRGIQQQFHMSCQATTVQALKAELDPIYALKLHDENPDVSQLSGSDTIPMAIEQQAMLESDPTDLNQSDLAKVRNRVKTDPSMTSGVVGEFNRILNLAQTNWEKNKLLWVIAEPAKYSPAQVEQWYNTNVKGKGPKPGQAVHKTVLTALGAGRHIEDLLKKTKDVTGLDFQNKPITDSNRDAAVDDIAQDLTLGRPVALYVGGSDGVTKHAVLAVAFLAGPPKTFFIHDPANGTTVARTEAQLKGSDMKMPSGWDKLTLYVKPTPV